MSQVLGVEISHPDNASLHDMIELGMIKYVGKLEEISVAATKEYQLENALEKMKTEWDSVCFESVPYRLINLFLTIPNVFRIKKFIGNGS